MTDQELVDYYTNLLVIQYKTLPLAIGTIDALATEVVANQIYSQVLNGFDIETAIGEQLDILGSYVGANRFLANFSSSAGYMAFPLYADATASTVVGFSLYADTVAPVGYWRLYSTTDTSLTMSDGEMRLLIQYLIALHASDTTIYSIDLLLQEFFGQYATLTDNFDMTITYTHNSTDPSQLFAIAQFIDALPKPAGVGITVVTI